MARQIIELLNACFRDKTLDAMGEFNAHLQQEGRFYHAGTDIPQTVSSKAFRGRCVAWSAKHTALERLSKQQVWVSSRSSVDQGPPPTFKRTFRNQRK
jgi:hypothetical protein